MAMASLTESNNLLLRANVAALELQAMETSNSVVKIDPLNAPIKSINAQVFFIIVGTNFSQLDSSGSFATGFPPSAFGRQFGKSMFIEGTNGALLDLQCKTYESLPIHFGSELENGNTDVTPNERWFSMTFSWPNAGIASSLDTNWWIERNNASVSAVDNAIVGAEIFVPYIPGGSEIRSGHCIVTFNGSIERRFSFPKFTDPRGFIILCQPMQTNGPQLKNLVH